MREELRRTEVVAALVADCRRRMSGSGMRCDVESTPKGAPVGDRIWTVAIVDRSGRRHDFHRPVHSDDVDSFAGVVRAGLDRWIGVVARRSSMHAVDGCTD